MLRSLPRSDLQFDPWLQICSCKPWNIPVQRFGTQHFTVWKFHYYQWEEKPLFKTRKNTENENIISSPKFWDYWLSVSPDWKHAVF